MRGSIRQRGDTFTAYWFSADPKTGKRVQHSKGGFVRKEPARPARGDSAREFLNALMGQVQEGTWRAEMPLSVAMLLTQQWLPAQRSRELAPSTISQYAMVVDSWLVPNIGGVRVSALTPKVMSELVQTLRTSPTSAGRNGLSPRSAQLAVGVLKAACAWALANSLIGRDPIAGVRRPRGNSTAMRAWSVEEARRFLEAVAGDRLAFAWALLLTRGLRRGELCGLTWSDIDLKRGAMQIRATRIVVDGKAIPSKPKTNAGYRSIPLDRSLVAILRAHQVAQGREKLAAGAAYGEAGYLVSDELGQPYYPDSISTWFDLKVKVIGLPRIRLHDTRHTAASLMLATGVPVKVVSEMLGHGSPTITLAIYAHVMPGMAEEAGAALSASLLG